MLRELISRLHHRGDGGSSAPPAPAPHPQPAREHRGFYYSGLGERSLKSRNVPEALKQFGRAIDEFIETADYDAAIELCQRVIAEVPQAVRTRGTLAFLLLGRGSSNAEAELASYVQAAQRADTSEYAIQMLRMMGTTTDDTHVCQLLHDHLHKLGDDEGAAEVLARHTVPDGADHENAQMRWLKLLRTRVTGHRRGRLLSREAPTARYSGSVEIARPGVRV